MKLGAPGKISAGLTKDGYVMITIYAQDGTETAMAVAYTHFQTLANKVKDQWVERRRRFVTGDGDEL